MKKLTFQKSGIYNGVLRIQGIDVVWSKKAMCYVARVLFEPKRESVCVENEIVGMRLYAETERAMDVGRILRTFKIKKNVEVTDNGKIII